MNAFEQLVTDVPGRAVRLLVVASACTGLVAVLSGMSHKWDDAPTQTVEDPVFAKMAPVPERVKAKTFTDPAPVEAGASGPAARMTLATPAAAAPAPAGDRVAAFAPTGEAAPAHSSQKGTDDLDETASIPPEQPQPPPKPDKREADLPKADLPKADLPKAEALTLKVPTGVRVRSGSSFTIGPASYRLTDVESIAAESCKRGARGCRRQPMRTLRQAIAGATLKCSASTSGSSTVLSDCTKIKAGGRSRRASGKRTRVARR
jgi:hypothetical protein